MTYRGKPPRVASNALSEATARGFPYIDLEGGKEKDGVWYSAFTKGVDKKGPRLYVGLREGVWDFFLSED